MIKQDYHYEGDPILKVTDVSLELPGEKPGDMNLILRDINLEIKNVVRPGKITGQIVGLLGPSGRGKTQMFNIIAGLRKPTTGEIIVNGKPVASGDIGVVAQKYPLFMHRSILGNLELAASKNDKLTPAERKDKIEFYLTRFKMTDKAKSYPAKLSGGQRQRVAIIQQLLCSEHFLLMDEPFSGLDVIMLNEVCEAIVEVANLDELNTVILVSHDYHSTAAISTQLWFLGYEYDQEGNIIPGAKIRYEENLMDRGFSWNYPAIVDEPEFSTFTRSVRKTFETL